MLRFLLCYLAVFSLSGLVQAQDAVSVERVKFDKLREDWLRMEIRLKCNGNFSPQARNKNFVENIVVKPLIVYATGSNDFRFYSAEVEVMIMKAGDANRVYFYIPGHVFQRDKLKVRPDYYYVEIKVDGTLQQPIVNGAALGSSIKSLDMLRNMEAKAKVSLSENENLLMPVYFVPGRHRGTIDDLPLFVRHEPKPSRRGRGPRRQQEEISL